uniref:Uncharacterized protein n=1 Tax=Amphimedon queenslandica TaxID=400682 RepID=A0A1X7UQD9_AMPQE
MEEIPDELVINWDHMEINYIPASNWTIVEEGVNRMKIVGLGDKQLTVVFACSLNGDFLPPQVSHLCWKDSLVLTLSFLSEELARDIY